MAGEWFKPADQVDMSAFQSPPSVEDMIGDREVPVENDEEKVVIQRSHPQAAPGRRSVVVDYEDQGGVVVKKVSKIKGESIETAEGITSTVSVGAEGSMDVGEVTFGGSNDGITMNKTGTAGDDFDVDVNDLLQGI